MHPGPGDIVLSDSRIKQSAKIMVQVVGPTDGWILERLRRRLADKLPYAAFVPWEPSPDGAAAIAYYVNYAIYRGPTGLVDVGYFTHPEDGRFLESACHMDHCVCMARQYAEWLSLQGVRAVSHIPMGFDFYRYRPQLLLAVVGLLAHPRKGGRLVEALRRLPFVQILTTEGQLSDDALREVYQRADYVLIPATLEGGPLCLLEGLAMGKPVIAPEGVGLIPEFGPTPYLRRYPAGDAAALVQLVTQCLAEKLQATRLVADRTWDHWAAGHHELFCRLLRSAAWSCPHPRRVFASASWPNSTWPPERMWRRWRGRWTGWPVRFTSAITSKPGPSFRTWWRDSPKHGGSWTGSPREREDRQILGVPGEVMAFLCPWNEP